ncbi:MAG: hypothetical protein Q4G46_10320, partial [Propionibacteriaceae bacterium]|nr:hypothetical protein [Propionibacteriaceae bacterium]
MRLPGPVGLILVMVLTTLFVPTGAQAAARPFTLHVSPTGHDTHPGTASQPLRTLTAARDRLRAEPDRDRPFIVELHAGRFELDTSFHLGAADSGTAEAPITYRARPGAVLTGARTDPTEAIEPVADPTIRARLDPSVRDRVRQINLRTLGITDPVTRAPQVTGADRPTGVQLIQGAVMGHDARYPDRGEQLKIAGVQSDGQRPVWRIDDRTPFAWAPSPDLWVEGYPGFDWAYQMQRVLAMNPTNATITLDTPAEFGSKAGQPFHFRHVLEALNQPDEFFTDEPRGLMYFLPTGDPLTLTILSDPLIVGE